jgi:signal transduction histidine kinase
MPGSAAGRSVVWPLGLLLAITIAMALDRAGAPSVLRHLYLVPALWAAVSEGARGGGLVGLVALLVQAPFTLPAMERHGLGPESVDGLVSMIMPAALGGIVGGVVVQSRTRAQRLRTVLGLQQHLLHEAPLDQRLALAADCVREVLDASRVALVVGSASDPPVVGSAPAGFVPAAHSAVEWTLREGRAVVARDLERDPRFAFPCAASPCPVRGLVLPLVAGWGVVGALAVERSGGFGSGSRAVAGEIALHLALAVENARLTLRQRRFTEELEEKVGAATERLRQIDQAKSEFVSVVAHELRTPLTALQGFTELLLSRTVPPERAARFLGHLHGEAERLGRIVAELLDLSRLETGQPLALRREAVDLSRVIERNVELLGAQHQRHRFHWSPCPGAGTVHADPDAVDRILKNLISNAVKYSPDGGRVVVRTRAPADRPGMVEVSVEDDGIGIPADQLARIFDKYVRVADCRTPAVRGLGLGLALVRALAEAHGGSVEVLSKPGKGSTFRVFLPGPRPDLADFPDSSA